MSLTEKPKFAVAIVVLLLIIGIIATVYFLTPGEPVNTPISPQTALATTQATTNLAWPDDSAKLTAIRKEIEKARNGRSFNRSDVVDVGFAYLADHLNDPTVAKFDPLAGFTHYTVSGRDPGETYLLVERISPPPDMDNHDGLNLKFDPDSGEIVEVKYWGSHKTK